MSEVIPAEYADKLLHAINGLDEIPDKHPDLDLVLKAAGTLLHEQEKGTFKDAERYRKIKRLVGEEEKITVMRNAKGFSVSSIDIRDTVRRWQYDTLDQAVDEVVE